MSRPAHEDAADRLPRPRSRSWGIALVALVVIGAIVWLRRHEPSYEERVAPVLIRGEPGQRVLARNFAVTVPVTALRTARTLRAPRPRSYSGERIVLRTAGLWLMVPATIETLRDTGVVSAQLRSRDGLVYPASPNDRPDAKTENLAMRITAPGLPERGRYFFELPADRLQGLRLQLFWGGLTPGSNDALVDIDLGIDAPRARMLRQQAPAVMEIAP